MTEDYSELLDLYSQASGTTYLEDEMATALSDLIVENEKLRSALHYYFVEFCEHGKFDEGCGKYDIDHCSGCMARAALGKTK
jgi:hypothetical protein